MAFSMHSHSGQFCPGHAQDTLEAVIQTAIARGMHTFALTEHMPRNSEADLYPEEISAGDKIDHHHTNHHAYIAEAVRLRSKYAEEITILIGFEGEWIRGDYGPLVLQLAADPAVDFFIGSVHHVHGHPIDYNVALYAKAVAASGGTEEGCYEAYFDAQFEMLNVLKPRVVGHFDLIRLLATQKDKQLDSMPGIWEKVLRNLRVVVEQGGLLEVNSAGLRKGLKEPYPGRAVCEAFMGDGGTFHADHGVAQVGTNYGRAVAYLEGLGVEEVWTLGKAEGGLVVKSVSLADVKATFKE
ncbi:putative histidinol-phosphatase [Lachnellula suecica]|uniref:Histidinol-phosphatase n=1 Tax=Lachnellula suecica TaxID=602035 RepID=A0A8T9CED1_9HELO|nr:putative histidinol-phosphatase [Lachnellula suecica]